MSAGQHHDGTPPDLRHRRVLVVDDNRDAVAMEALLLEMLGQSVWRAYDGESALRLAGEHAPEIVLVDLEMPGMNGFDVVRELRKLPSMHNACIIAYTGTSHPEHRAAAEAAGFNEIVQKPFALTRLLTILRT